MTERKNRQAAVISRDLITGEVIISHRRVRKAPHAPSQLEKQLALKRWWPKFILPFLAGAEAWRGNEGAKIATDSGQNVEEKSAETTEINADGELEKTISTAKGSHISAFDIVSRLGNQTRIVKDKLGPDSGWMDTYSLHVLEIIGNVYNLGSEKRRALEAYLTHPVMPDFN